MTRKNLSLACVVILAGSAMSAAQASGLTGDVISGSYAYPCDTCTYTGNFTYFTNPFVVAGPAAKQRCYSAIRFSTPRGT
jgi:hypothetical protein